MSKYYIKDGDEYKEVTAFDQDELNETIARRLERERSKYADYEAMKEQLAQSDSVKAEYEAKLKEAADREAALQGELGNAKLETERVKILSEFKISDDLAEFVTGSNVEEMRGRAEKLAHSMTGGAVQIDKAEKPAQVPADKAGLAQVTNQLFGHKD